MTDIQRLVSNGKISKLKSHLEKGTVSIDDRLPNSWSALHLAVEENKIKMAKFLIDNGADIEAKTDTGFTPLMTAVQSGNLEAMKMLLSNEADINAQNSYHATPLMLAIADGKLSIIQYLLKNGADTEITDYRKQKAADWAEERGNHEALSYITKHEQEQQGKLTKEDIASVMERGHVNGSIHKRESGATVGPNSLRLPSIPMNNIPRPSNVSMMSSMTTMSEYGETEFLNMQSQITNLKDRIEELEIKLASKESYDRRLERLESRLGINEMLRLVERNRDLEEKIKKLENSKK